MPRLLHSFLLLLKCALSQHGANLQQTIYQALRAALSAWQILVHLSIAVFCACSAGWVMMFLFFLKAPIILTAFLDL